MFKDTKGPVGAVEQGKQDTFSLIESMENKPNEMEDPMSGSMAPTTPAPTTPGPIAPVSSQPNANGGESTEEKPECDTCGESKCDKCEESTCDT